MEKKYTAMNVPAGLPMNAIQDSCLISPYGDLTVVYKVLIAETCTTNSTEKIDLGSNDYWNTSPVWEKAICELPDNTIVYKQDWFSAVKHSSTASAESYLDQAESMPFIAQPYTYDNCFLFITKMYGEQKDVTSIRGSVGCVRFLPNRKTNRIKINSFFSSLKQFVSVINSTHQIHLVWLRDDALCDLLGQLSLLESDMSININEMNAHIECARFYALQDSAQQIVGPIN